MSNITARKIEKMIYVVRGIKVMLDEDLSELYGVETKRLNEQVKRNIKRFPSDFLMTLTRKEYSEILELRGEKDGSYGGRRKLPNAFSENGVAMLSSVLQSDKAIKVNISIMRTFTKMRQLLASDESLVDRITNLEKDSKEMVKVFKIVFEKLDQLEGKLPSLSPTRKKIGLKSK